MAHRDRTAEDSTRAARRPPGDEGSRRAGWGSAVAIGLVATGITLAAGELLAALAAWLRLIPQASTPFGALGTAFIDITPAWLKDFGIAAFGQHDKVALAVAMVVTFAIVGAVIGVVGRVSPAASMAIGTVLVAVTCVAIGTRPDSGVTAWIPMVLGGVAGLMFLRAALRAAAPRFENAADGAVLATPVTPTVDGDDEAALDRVGPPVARRRALRMAGVGAGAAALAGVLAKLTPEPVDVQADRAAVVLPPAAPETTAVSPTAGPSSTGAGVAARSTAVRPPRIVVPPALPPGVDPDITDLTPYVTPQGKFYRVDTAFILPHVTTESWRLKVHGMVRHPFEIGWSDLTALPQIERWITLTCVSNRVGGDLVGNASWQGARIADVLARAQPLPGADCVLSTSADDFTVTTPLNALTDGRDALLAIGMDREPLPVKHGFPVRMVVPGLYGYVSATKWVVDLEVTTFAHATSFWTGHGWAERAPIKTASRIDTPQYDVTVGPGVVPVAGVAWAQHRGISAVEVQVDDGPWERARLHGAASADTWVQWVYRWDTSIVSPGSHTLRCRAVDGTGAVQTAAQEPPLPNGSSGYHTVPVVVG